MCWAKRRSLFVRKMILKTKILRKMILKTKILRKMILKTKILRKIMLKTKIRFLSKLENFLMLNQVVRVVNMVTTSLEIIVVLLTVQ